MQRITSTRPPGDWFRNEHVTQIGIEAMKVRSRILGNFRERNLVSFCGLRTEKRKTWHLELC